MKEKLLLVIGFCLFMFSCSYEDKRDESIQIVDTINFEDDWANIDIVKMLTFPINRFPNISNDYEQSMLSYYRYGFDISQDVKADTTEYAKFLLIRSFHPAIFCEIYRVGDLFYYEMKVNNKNDGSFGKIVFNQKQEISDSIFYSFFSSSSELGYWRMDAEPEDEGITDGSVWFFEIKDSSKHKYIVRYSPTYYPKGSGRANEKELKGVEKMGMYLLNISEMEKILSPMY